MEKRKPSHAWGHNGFSLDLKIINVVIIFRRNKADSEYNPSKEAKVVDAFSSMVILFSAIKTFLRLGVKSNMQFAAT